MVLKVLNLNKIDTTVLYRDENCLIFDDEFPISYIHICIIPIEVIEDITELNEKHIELIEHMYHKGVENIKNRNLELYKNENIEEIFSNQFYLFLIIFNNIFNSY
jgi:diadenosine tetraphosphate (Ap4A) HIT family hydrolase